MAKMTKEDREAFLKDVRVGVLSIADGENGPLTAPVWYDYEPGGTLWFLTGENSMKGRCLANVERVSLCVQQEDLPYAYVSIEGPIIERAVADKEAHSRPMAQRYLGKELGDAYVKQNEGTPPSTLYRVKPERWLTTDYGK